MKTATFRNYSGENENSLILFSLHFAENRVILQLFQTSTPAGPYVYDL